MPEEIKYKYNIGGEWDDVMLEDGQSFAGIHKKDGLLFCMTIFGMQCLGDGGCLCVGSNKRSVMVQ